MANYGGSEGQGPDGAVEKPFSATFKLEKETKNTVRYAEEAKGRRPVVGTVYIDKYELPKPYPQTIRVSIEPAEYLDCE